MPSIDPTKVPLFASSICVFVVQAHLLLPPPLSRRRSPSPLTLHARCVEWPIHHVPKNRLQPDANIVRDRVHPALLAKYSRPWHTLFCVPRPARGFTPQDFGIFHRGCRQDEPNLNSRETLSRVFFSRRSTPPTATLISQVTCRPWYACATAQALSALPVS